jgi:membrane-bound lytic murein transglycosylase A
MRISRSVFAACRRTLNAAFPISFLVAIAGCVAMPDVPAIKPCIGQCPICPVCPLAETPISAPAIPTPPSIPAIVAPAESARGRLEHAEWSQLPNFAADDPSAALAAFVQGCSVLINKPEWQDVCLRAVAWPGLPPGASPGARAADVRQFFVDNFEPHRILNADETDTGLVTGYYEPLLRGSRTRTSEFRFPLYAPPPDLITVELSEIYPDLKNRRLRGRLVGNKLVPYLDRSAIDGEGAAPALRGLEIAWVDNAVESFFLQIQGSGQIQLPDGSRMRVGYADQNGHPFRSLAGQLIRKGEIKAERASMQGIKDWARRYPAKVQQFMNANPSYVFFKELPENLSGPIGTLGVPLTAERSIAIDPRVTPLGVPVYLSTTFPNSKVELNRLMVAQDTGGAINGAVRADFFWGFGDTAGSQAGRMKQQGRMWVLLPRGYDPEAPVVPVTPALGAPQTSQPPPQVH